jgi:hypothetical protein
MLHLPLDSPETSPWTVDQNSASGRSIRSPIVTPGPGFVIDRFQPVAPLMPSHRTWSAP